MLKRGGHAVDAAVTTAFTQTAVDAHSSSIAGLGVMRLFPAETEEEERTS